MKFSGTLPASRCRIPSIVLCTLVLLFAAKLPAQQYLEPTGTPADITSAELLDAYDAAVLPEQFAYESTTLLLTIERPANEQPPPAEPFEALGLGGDAFELGAKPLTLLELNVARLVMLFAAPSSWIHRFESRTVIVDGETHLQIDRTRPGDHVRWSDPQQSPPESLRLREGDRHFVYRKPFVWCSADPAVHDPAGWRSAILGWRPEDHGGELDPRAGKEPVGGTLTDAVYVDEASGDFLRLYDHNDGNGTRVRRMQRFPKDAPGATSEDVRVTYDVSDPNVAARPSSWSISRRYLFTKQRLSDGSIPLPEYSIEIVGTGEILLRNATYVEMSNYRYKADVPNASERWGEFDAELRSRVEKWSELVQQRYGGGEIPESERDLIGYPPMVLDDRIPAESSYNIITYWWSPEMPTDEQLREARRRGETHVKLARPRNADMTGAE